MPLYGSQPAQVLVSGFVVNLFNAESPAVSQSSIQIASAHSRVYNPTTFSVQQTGTPGTFIIMGAMVDLDSAYQQLYQTTQAFDTFIDGSKFKFYRAKCLVAGIGTITISVSN